MFADELPKALAVACSSFPSSEKSAAAQCDSYVSRPEIEGVENVSISRSSTAVEGIARKNLDEGS